MDWITSQIAIGNYLDAVDGDLLRHEGLQSALSLDATLHGRNPADLGLKRIEVVSLEDAPGNDPRLFRRAIDYLVELVEQSPPVLVQCHAGRSRSAVVVAGYLMHTSGLDSHEAIQLVASKREIAITAGVERLLEHLA